MNSEGGGVYHRSWKEQKHRKFQKRILCCCSVPKSCLILWPQDCSMPVFPMLHYLPELAKSLIWWCHPTILFSIALFSSCPQSFPATASFRTSQLFASGGQSIGASASASVLPMNIQDHIDWRERKTGDGNTEIPYCRGQLEWKLICGWDKGHFEK